MVIEEHITGKIEKYTDGSWETAFYLTDSNVISASCKRQCCADGSFEIGGVYASTISIVCRLQGTNSFSLRGKKITLYSQYASEETRYCIGVFWITSASRFEDIYTIDAQDAVGWLDTSSMIGTNDTIYDSVYKYFETQSTGYTIQGWFGKLTEYVNTLLTYVSGVENMLGWVNYADSDNNDLPFCNEFIYAYDSDSGTYYRTVYYVTPFLSTEVGSGLSDSPRDFFNYLAEIAGGFVYARPEDGKLTLGQFGQAKFDTVTITSEECEYDSLEVADFVLKLLNDCVQSEIQIPVEGGYGYASYSFWTNPIFDENYSYIRYWVHDNPFVDGFTAAYIRGDAAATVPSLMTLAHGLWLSFYNDDNPFTVRPFEATVHSEKRYNLGQKIVIDNHESIITGIQWMFRGGHQLACGGEDARVMSDCFKASKGDKAMQEARKKCAQLEKKIANL